MRSILTILKLTHKKPTKQYIHTQTPKQIDLSFIITAEQAKSISDKVFAKKEKRRLKFQQELMLKEQARKEINKSDSYQQILNLHALFAQIDKARREGKYAIDVDDIEFTSYQKQFLKELGYTFERCSEWTDNGFLFKSIDLVWD